MTAAHRNAVCIPSANAACAWCLTAGPSCEASASDERAWSAAGPGEPGRGCCGSRLQDAAEDGDPEGATELARQVVHRRADTLLLARECIGDRRRGGSHRQRHPRPERDEPDQQRPVAAVAVQRREPAERSAAAISTRPRTQVRAVPIRVASFGASTRAVGIRPNASGTRLSAAISGLSPQHQLEVLQQQEDEAEEREELHGDRDRPGGEAAVGEQPRVEQRLLPACLEGHEAGEADEAGREPGERPRRRSSRGWAPR